MAEQATIYLVFGDDEFLVSEKAGNLVDQVCPPEERDFGLEIVDGRTDAAVDASQVLARCLDALNTVGLLGGKKTVWLRNWNAMSSSALSRSVEVKERVDAFVDVLKSGLMDGHTLIISAEKIDKRSSFFKTLKRIGEVSEYSAPEKAYQAVAVAEERAHALFKKEGITVPEHLLTRFLEKTGMDTRQVSKEVEKLSIYLGDRNEVAVEDIDEVVSATREAIAWDLADAVGRRDLKSALQVLRQLLFQKESAVGLIIGLENRFRELIIMRECLDRGWLSLSGKAPWQKAAWKVPDRNESLFDNLSRDPRKTNPYRCGKLAAQANQFSMQELLRGESLVLDTHERLLSSSMPEDLSLEYLIIRLIGSGSGRTRKSA